MDLTELWLVSSGVQFLQFTPCHIANEHTSIFGLPQGFHPAALTARWHSALQSGTVFWHIYGCGAFHCKTC